MKAGPAITEDLPHFLSSPLSPPGGQFIPSCPYSSGSEKQRLQPGATRLNYKPLASPTGKSSSSPPTDRKQRKRSLGGHLGGRGEAVPEKGAHSKGEKLGLRHLTGSSIKPQLMPGSTPGLLHHICQRSSYFSLSQSRLVFSSSVT